MDSRERHTRLSRVAYPSTSTQGVSTSSPLTQQDRPSTGRSPRDRVSLGSSTLARSWGERAERYDSVRYQNMGLMLDMICSTSSAGLLGTAFFRPQPTLIGTCLISSSTVQGPSLS